jgi:hypothetical protein
LRKRCLGAGPSSPSSRPGSRCLRRPNELRARGGGGGRPAGRVLLLQRPPRSARMISPSRFYINRERAREKLYQDVPAGADNTDRVVGWCQLERWPLDNAAGRPPPCRHDAVSTASAAPVRIAYTGARSRANLFLLNCRLARPERTGRARAGRSSIGGRLEVDRLVFVLRESS